MQYDSRKPSSNRASRTYIPEEEPGFFASLFGSLFGGFGKSQAQPKSTGRTKRSSAISRDIQLKRMTMLSAYDDADFDELPAPRATHRTADRKPASAQPRVKEPVQKFSYEEAIENASNYRSEKSFATATPAAPAKKAPVVQPYEPELAAIDTQSQDDYDAFLSLLDDITEQPMPSAKTSGAAVGYKDDFVDEPFETLASKSTTIERRRIGQLPQNGSSSKMSCIALFNVSKGQLPPAARNAAGQIIDRKTIDFGVGLPPVQ